MGKESRSVLAMNCLSTCSSLYIYIHLEFEKGVERIHVRRCIESASLLYWGALVWEYMVLSMESKQSRGWCGCMFRCI